MDSIDLRSDTVTHPTPAMREAMATAEVGDDVWGDDPTTIQLEALAAERLGKEAALFVSSGTQGNLTAILTHCQRGDEMIVGYRAHTFVDEVGGASALGGIHPHTLPVQQDGTIALEDIRAAVRNPDDVHFPLTRLIELENTQGLTGGIAITAEYTQSVRNLCDEYGLKLHLDGARLWNAATALNVDIKELAAPVDSVTFCLSKGLCAPVGSILCGTEEFINRARRVRKMLGGGMRQTGILAAAGIMAIEEMTIRLDEDHATARLLGDKLSAIDDITLDYPVYTNMVFFSLDESLSIDASMLVKRLETEYDVKMGVFSPRSIRAVTHYWITPERVEMAANAVQQVVENTR